MALEKLRWKASLYPMKARVAHERVLDIQSEGREIARRQLQDWFDWMDRILDIHRSNFVFRQATPKELEEHGLALKAAIRTSHLIHALVADPDFNDSNLTSRLQVRIRQLQDAYDTFHDAAPSDDEGGKILKEVFPE